VLPNALGSTIAFLAQLSIRVSPLLHASFLSFLLFFQKNLQSIPTKLCTAFAREMILKRERERDKEQDWER